MKYGENPRAKHSATEACAVRDHEMCTDQQHR